MLKSYEAIYNEGRVEWVGEAPTIAHARVLVVVEETLGETAAPNPKRITNGDSLAEFIEQWDESARRTLVEKFGDPVEWQREQRQDRTLPGREND